MYTGADGRRLDAPLSTNSTEVPLFNNLPTFQSTAMDSREAPFASGVPPLRSRRGARPPAVPGVVHASLLPSPHSVRAALAVDARRASAAALTSHAASVSILASVARARESRVHRLAALARQRVADARRAAIFAARAARRVTASPIRVMSSAPLSALQVRAPAAPLDADSSTGRAHSAAAAVSTRLVRAALKCLDSLLFARPPTSFDALTAVIEQRQTIVAASVVIKAIMSTQPPASHSVAHGPRALLAALLICRFPEFALSSVGASADEAEQMRAGRWGSRVCVDASVHLQRPLIVAAGAVVAQLATLAELTACLNASNSSNAPTNAAREGGGGAHAPHTHSPRFVPRGTEPGSFPRAGVALDASPHVSPRTRSALTLTGAELAHAALATEKAHADYAEIFSLWRAASARAVAAPLATTYRELVTRRASLQREAMTETGANDAGLADLRTAVDDQLSSVRGAAARLLGANSNSFTAWCRAAEGFVRAPPASPLVAPASPLVAPASPSFTSAVSSSAPSLFSAPAAPPGEQPHVTARVPNLLPRVLRNAQILHELIVAPAFSLPPPVMPDQLRAVVGGAAAGAAQDTDCSPAACAAGLAAAEAGGLKTEAAWTASHWSAVIADSGCEAAVVAVVEGLSELLAPARASELRASIFRADDLLSRPSTTAGWLECLSGFARLVEMLEAPARNAATRAWFASLYAHAHEGRMAFEDALPLLLAFGSFKVSTIRVDAANALLAGLRPQLGTIGDCESRGAAFETAAFAETNTPSVRARTAAWLHARISKSGSTSEELTRDARLSRLAILRDGAAAIIRSPVAATRLQTDATDAFPALFAADVARLETLQNLAQSVALSCAISTVVSYAARRGGTVTSNPASRNDAENYIFNLLDDSTLTLDRIVAAAVEAARAIAQPALFPDVAAETLVKAIRKLVAEPGNPTLSSFLDRAAESLRRRSATKILALLASTPSKACHTHPRAWGDACVQDTLALSANTLARLDAGAVVLARMTVHAAAVHEAELRATLREIRGEE